MGTSYNYPVYQSAQDPGSDSAYDPYKAVVVHSYKQHPVRCFYRSWQPMILGSMRTKLWEFAKLKCVGRLLVEVKSVNKGFTRAQ